MRHQWYKRGSNTKVLLFQAEGRVSAKAPAQEWIWFFKEKKEGWCDWHVVCDRGSKQERWCLRNRGTSGTQAGAPTDIGSLLLFCEVFCVSWPGGLFCVWQSRRHSKPINVKCWPRYDRIHTENNCLFPWKQIIALSKMEEVQWNELVTKRLLDLHVFYVGFPQRLTLRQGFVLRRWSLEVLGCFVLNILKF